MTTLCIFGCQNFHLEIQACLADAAWPDVVSRAFPARCGRPPVSWDELRALLPEDCSDVVVLGRACLGALGAPPPDFPATRVLVQEQCFHLVAGTTMVAEVISARGYLITPGWLQHWQQHIADLGFTSDSAGSFFRDFANHLVLLDTGIDNKAADRLAALQAALGLPAQRIGVGLDHMRLFVNRLVLEWRLGQSQSLLKQRTREHARELADHTTAMDLLARMTKSRTEAEVIGAIEDLFRMLFAPAVWHYVAAEPQHGTGNTETPAAICEEVRSLNTAYGWTRSNHGFLLRVAREEHVFGHIVVDGLAFPQHRERYLNLALAMTDMMALAIENARTRKRLVEAEKMASLGVMVAGVAHEINTPVGVGVLAASTMQSRTLSLSQSFSERRMTQSDLQGYLKDSQAQSSLILSNLERIGLLIDKFRQVAVNGLPQTKSRFRVKKCLDEVVLSFGDRLPSERFRVTVMCDDALELDSYPGDWTSIFTNFIANSLQHGFKGRELGCIQVQIAQTQAILSVIYSDDGIGLTPAARERIFDPFFTTDMQNGIGLGMHLVYNLITQRLGGRIEVDGNPGVGVCFRIEIPTHDDLREMK
jgi:signal transduction histidine kinase